MNLLSQLALLWLMGSTTCHEYWQLRHAAEYPLRNRTSCLHAPPSKLIRFQAGFNPHPEVGWVNWFTTRITAFTRIWFRLIWILNQFKCPV